MRLSWPASAAVPTDDPSYGSAELDKILRERRESLKRIKADLRKVEELQREFEAARDQPAETAGGEQAGQAPQLPFNG